jgi:hypothetical protein
MMRLLEKITSGVDTMPPFTTAGDAAIHPLPTDDDSNAVF